MFSFDRSQRSLSRSRHCIQTLPAYSHSTLCLFLPWYVLGFVAFLLGFSLSSSPFFSWSFQGRLSARPSQDPSSPLPSTKGPGRRRFGVGRGGSGKDKDCHHFSRWALAKSDPTALDPPRRSRAWCCQFHNLVPMAQSTRPLLSLLLTGVYARYCTILRVTTCISWAEDYYGHYYYCCPPPSASTTNYPACIVLVPVC